MSCRWSRTCGRLILLFIWYVNVDIDVDVLLMFMLLSMMLMQMQMQMSIMMMMVVMMIIMMTRWGRLCYLSWEESDFALLSVFVFVLQIWQMILNQSDCIYFQHAPPCLVIMDWVLSSTQWGFVNSEKYSEISVVRDKRDTSPLKILRTNGVRQQ